MADDTRPPVVAVVSSAWLALALFVAKAATLVSNFGEPGNPGLLAARFLGVIRDDTLIVLGFALVAAVLSLAVSKHPRAARLVDRAIVACAVTFAAYAALNVRAFPYLQGPLTFPLFRLAWDVRQMRESLRPFLTLPLAAVLVGTGAVVLGGIRLSLRSGRACDLATSRRTALVVALLAVAELVVGTVQRRALPVRDHSYGYAGLSSNVIAVLASSFVESGSQRGLGAFPPEDLKDFEPEVSAPRPPPGARPRNVILLVLESTAAQYLGLYGETLATTPHLDAEATAHAVVFDSFYAHVGATESSLFAMTLSAYPELTWRRSTREQPHAPGTTLAHVLGQRGYHTAFIQSGDLAWAGEREFLTGRGFDELQGGSDLACPAASKTAWGATDRCLVDSMLGWMDRARSDGRPFYLMSWTSETHHPYVLSSDHEYLVPPQLAATQADYFNVLHDVDTQLGRLFDGLRARGLDRDTVVVITGDHGEAFGVDHPTYMHGFDLYEENVHVPFIVWSPALFPTGRREAGVGGHVDVNPTLAGLLGIAPDAHWVGRDLLGASPPSRAYFFATWNHYLLGVRSGRWKMILDVGSDHEELYDLAADPREQVNRAGENPSVCRDLHERLAAWATFVFGKAR